MLVHLWPVVEFTDKTFIQPLRVPPNAALTVSVDQTASTDEWTVLGATMVLTNKSSRNVHVVHSWFNLFGYDFGSNPVQAELNEYIAAVQKRVQDDTAAEDSIVSALSTSDSAAREHDLQVLYSGKFGEWQPWFRSGEEFSTHLLFAVPSNRFSVARLRIDVTYTTDIEHICEFWNTGGRGDLWGDAYDNVRGPRWTIASLPVPLVEDVVPCDEQHSIREQMQQIGGDTWKRYWRESFDRAYARYGLSHTYSTAEIPLRAGSSKPAAAAPNP